MMDEAALEAELFAVGSRLARDMPAQRNPLKAIDDRAMDLASQDAELKAALFRFVDVVPACRSLDDLSRHLVGFLREVETRPPPISVAMRMGNTKAGRTALGAAAATGVRHMAHRFIVGESPKAALGVLRDLWKDGVASSVDLLGEATVTQAEAQRYADRCAEALDTLADAVGRWPARPQLERDSAGRAAAREPLGEGVRAHAAAAPRRARARPARRRRPPAPAAAPGARARRAPAHRHGVDGLARRGARARARPARRGRVPRRAVGRHGPAGLPARLAAEPRHDRRLARARRARPSADGAAGQGRLLGPRARRGAPARLAEPGVRAQGRHRPQLRAAHPADDRRPLGRSGAARGDRLAQPALGRPCRRLQPALRRSRRGSRAAGAARPRRPAAGRDRPPGPARARLLPGRRPRRGHGLPRAAPAREHLQRLLPRRAGQRGLVEELLAPPRNVAGNGAEGGRDLARCRFACRRRRVDGESDSSVRERVDPRAATARRARRARRRARRARRARPGARAGVDRRRSPRGRRAAVDRSRAAGPRRRARRVRPARRDRGGARDRDARRARLGRHAGGRARRRAAARGGLDARAPASSSPRSRCARRRSRGARPTPTSARRSTSSSTTPAGRSSSRSGRRGCRARRSTS